MASIPLVVLGLLALLVVVAAVYDVRSRRIPNWLVLLGALLGMALNAVLYEQAGLKLSALGIGMALLVYVPLFAIRGMGAGDVKLMAAVGSIVGPVNWLFIFVLTAICGGILAVVLLVVKGRLLRAIRNAGFILWELFRLRAPYRRNEQLDVSHPEAVSLPHAVSIAIGSLVFAAILRVRGAS
ncbi:MAG: prepilin peptidase [Acidobacteria bacterium]|nr:prepilin peptidase [Acidobacteriota bacterium]